MKVVPWTVNRAEDMLALYEMGVDGMITDKAWILRQVLEEQGEELLPAGPCELPYHLEPDHIEAEDGGSKNGKDAAY